MGCSMVMSDSENLVLVASADAALASHFILLLRELGVLGESCGNTAQLCHRVSQVHPRFLILDREWPEIDGLELVRRLLALVPAMQIALVVEEGGVGTAAPFQQGVSLLFRKPLEGRRVMERLTAWLGAAGGGSLAGGGSGYGEAAPSARFRPGQDGSGDLGSQPVRGTSSPFAAFRKDRATQSPFGGSIVSGRVADLAAAASIASKVPAPPQESGALTPERYRLRELGRTGGPALGDAAALRRAGGSAVELTAAEVGFSPVSPDFGYRPRHLMGRSRATRLLVRDIWEHRDFRYAILVTGESGSEFELVAREIQSAGSFEEAMPIYLAPEDVSEERLADLNTQAMLAEGDSSLVFLPDIQELDALGRSALREFLESIRRSSHRKHLRLVLGAALDKVDGDSDAGPSSLETLMLLCEARLDIPPLRERQVEIPALARQILYSITTVHPFLRVRSIETRALEMLQRYLWKGNFEQLVNVLRIAASQCPHRTLSLVHIDPLLQSDLTSFQLLESSADDHLFAKTAQG